MSHVSTVLNQLLQLVPRHHFEKQVRKHSGDRYVKKFDSFSQFTVLLYAQIRGLDSLRDITEGLMAQSAKHYHLGLRSVAKSTLADANRLRDYRIYEGLFYELLNRFKSLTPDHPFSFKNPLYSMDASIINLSLAMFPWADYNKTKGAMKLHCLLDHRGNIPSFVTITSGRRHEVRVAKEADLPLLPDSIVTMDRGYIDFDFLYNLHQKGVFFVTRTKKNMTYKLTGLQKMPNVDGLVLDLKVRLTTEKSARSYPDDLRVIWWYDRETDKELHFLTNNFRLAASSISAIYKARWQIELFFKWIKQNLKIKTFLGTSPNAVLTQIWVAMCYYLLLAYLKFQSRYRYPLISLTRILKETVMERMSLFDLLSLDPSKGLPDIRAPIPQLSLF